MAQKRLYATLVTLTAILFLLAASAIPATANCHGSCLHPPGLSDDTDEIVDEVEDTMVLVFNSYSEIYRGLFGDED